MESPWVSQQPHRPSAERPWVGMALVITVPLLTLVLIRLLWSGSSLWFLTVGLILLGVAAVIFLARRPQDHEYSANALAQESNRVPLVVAGVGAFFLAMLLLPNFAGGSDGKTTPVPEASNQNNNATTSGGLTSGVAGHQGSGQAQPAAQQLAAQQPSAADTAVDDTAIDEATTGDTAFVDDSTVDDTDTTTDVVVPEGSQTYVVEEGDTLWDIATTFGTSVDAIILANGLDNPSDIQIDQELNIPPPDDNAATQDESAPVDDGATQ